MQWKVYNCYVNRSFVGRVDAANHEEAQERANAKFNTSVKISEVDHYTRKYSGTKLPRKNSTKNTNKEIR
jgi:hypothetical protein